MKEKRVKPNLLFRIQVEIEAWLLKVMHAF
jgi:hypothetical protein